MTVRQIDGSNVSAYQMLRDLEARANKFTSALIASCENRTGTGCRGRDRRAQPPPRSAVRSVAYLSPMSVKA